MITIREEYDIRDFNMMLSVVSAPNDYSPYTVSQPGAGTLIGAISTDGHSAVLVKTP